MKTLIIGIAAAALMGSTVLGFAAERTLTVYRSTDAAPSALRIDVAERGHRGNVDRGGYRGGNHGGYGNRGMDRNVNTNRNYNQNYNRNVNRSSYRNVNVNRYGYGNYHGGYGYGYGAYRPWVNRPYFGTMVAGVALGTLITATAVPASPSPELCWYWADSGNTQGYWDYCSQE